MTVKERIEADGVGMRWLRTAATTLTSVAAAVAVIVSTTVWFVGPRVADWIEALMDEATFAIRRDVERLGAVVTRLEDNVSDLDAQIIANIAPAWRFDLPVTHVSDAPIGGRATIQVGGFKLRECGIPRVDMWFVNGEGVYHRFEEPTILSADGRGIALPTPIDERSQVIRYRATIPDDEGVAPGRGQGYIAVTYPDTCPHVAEVIAGPLQFRIMEGSEQ